MAEIITDGSQKELKKHGSDEFPLLVSYEKLSGYKSGSFLWHWHPEIEITLVLDGQILYKVNQCTYHMKAGDILLGNANVLHAGFMEDMKDGKYVSIERFPYKKIQNMTALEKYIWIVRTLYNKGDRGLSLKELNDKWIHDENISNGEPLPRQTFDRWKGNILMILGVNIECRLKGGYRYYISNPECLSKGGLVRWLLDTYSTANTLSQSIQLKDRILVEEIPSNRNYLTDIIEAMKSNKVVTLTYKSFIHGSSHTFSVEPYCLKMFQKRWYLLAKNLVDNNLRIYGLDRLENFEETKEHFTMPKNFDANTYFSSFYGIVTDETIPLQRIVVRANRQHQHYLRSLPLHPTQKEIFTCKDYADFELTLRPTYDFIMELLSFGAMIEVMEPQSLRLAMKGWVSDLWELYEND